jgi:hypothetical protein
MASLYDLIGADEPTAAEQAAAMQKALRRQSAAGVLGSLTGDKVLGQVGQGLQAGAMKGEAGLVDVGQFRQRQAETARQHDATMRRQDAQTANERARIGLDRERMNREDWSAIADPVTGGIVMFNRRTGQQVRASGGAPTPGGLPPPRPKDLENDVQSLGKDTEQLSKMRPDLDTLKRGAQAEDTPGFGPIAGRLPDFLTSDEGIAQRQAAGRIMANIIQIISGQAASEKEVARHLKARGLGDTATPSSFQQGVAALEKEFNGLLQQREAKYHPAVVDTYTQRGGFTSKGKPSRVRVVSPDGKAGTIDASELQDALANGWREAK